MMIFLTIFSLSNLLVQIEDQLKKSKTLCVSQEHQYSAYKKAD